MRTCAILNLTVVAALAACSCVPHYASARERVPSSVDGSDAALDLLLTREAQRLLDADRIKRSQAANVTVSAQVDIERRKLSINFGPGFLPSEEDGSTEEIEQYIGNTLGVYADQAGLEDVEVTILYEGKPFEHYFPRFQDAGGG